MKKNVFPDREHEMTAGTWREELTLASSTMAKFYDRRAKNYDTLVHLLSLGMDRHYRRIAVQRLQVRPGDRVLDLGCGTGLDLPLLSRKVGPQGAVTGCDLSKEMLGLARQRIHQSGLGNIFLIQCHALELPFAGNSFQAVFCNYLLSTVPAGPVIEEVFRIARPGAALLFADDRLPSGWFASPLRAMGEFFRRGYFNYGLEGAEILKKRLSSLTVTNHHGGLIFILSGIFRG
ncbi:MAG: class I SAM-dependent methyltransferase [bacterium]